MKVFLRMFTVCFLVLALSRSAHGQGTRADYERANHHAQLTQGKVFYAQVTPHWTVDGNAFWYRNDGPDGIRRFMWVDAVAGTREPAFDHQKLATALGAAE